MARRPTHTHTLRTQLRPSPHLRVHDFLFYFDSLQMAQIEKFLFTSESVSAGHPGACSARSPLPPRRRRRRRRAAASGDAAARSHVMRPCVCALRAFTDKLCVRPRCERARFAAASASGVLRVCFVGSSLGCGFGCVLEAGTRCEWRARGAARAADVARAPPPPPPPPLPPPACCLRCRSGDA